MDISGQGSIPSDSVAANDEWMKKISGMTGVGCDTATMKQILQLLKESRDPAISGERRTQLDTRIGSLAKTGERAAYAASLPTTYRWYVSPRGNDDNNGTQQAPFYSIQAAINAASAGDAIKLENGTYYHTGRIYINKDVFLIGNVEDPSAVVIRPSGLGFYIYSCSPELHGMKITGGETGILINGGYPRFSHLVLTRHTRTVIYSDMTHVYTLENSLIFGNRVEGGSLIEMRPSGSAGGVVSVNNVTITDNEASCTFDLTGTALKELMISNSILYNPQTTDEIRYHSTGSYISMQYSDIYNKNRYSGSNILYAGNLIDALPDFEESDPGPTYRLSEFSPCIDAGHPYIQDLSRPPGMGEVRSDMGFYGGPSRVSLGFLPVTPGDELLSAIHIGTYNHDFSFADTTQSGLYTNFYYWIDGVDLFYKFTTTEWLDIEIDHCGSEVLDTKIMLLNAYGGNMTESGVRPGDKECSVNAGQAFLSVRNLPPGTYYVMNKMLADNNEEFYITIRGYFRGDRLENPVEVGTFGSGFYYTDTRNSSNYGNHYTGLPTNDIFHRFSITKMMNVEMSHCNSPRISQTRLYLLDAAGSLITGSEDYTGEGGCESPGQAYLKMDDLPAGTYYIVSEGYASDGDIRMNIHGYFRTVAPSAGFNYVHTIIPQEETSAIQGDSRSPSDYLETIDYFDGLGRPIQNVAVGSSPDGKDMITPVAYDGFGREAVKYLPYEAGDGTGSFRSAALTEQADFYRNGGTGPSSVTKSSTPFAVTVFESSPLSRVLKQGNPGGDWHPETGRVFRMYYKTNGSSEFRMWNITGTGAATGNYYAKGSLYRTETTDESNLTTILYENKQGKPVRQRIKYDSNTEYHTIYIYDHLDQLAYVLPPGVPDDVRSFTENDDVFLKLIYAYKYDGRGRTVRKHIPGAGWTDVVYDKLDRPVMTRTAAQKDSVLWRFTKYDAHDRPVMTGVISDNRERTVWQSLVNNCAYQWEERLDDGELEGYSNRCQPQVTLSDIHQFNYYDLYKNFTLPSGCSNRTRGLPTENRTRVLGSQEFYNSAWFYDEKGRMVQTQEQTAKGIDVIKNTYDFTGRLTASERTLEDVTVQTEQLYDHVGRPTDTRHRMDRGESVITTRCTYNPLGQLLVKRLHSTDGSSWLQEIDYTYNIRGWLTGINDGNAPGGSRQDAFSMRIIHNGTATVGDVTSKAQFNGNISSIRWRTKPPGTSATAVRGHAYAFSYDPIGRLTSAVYAADTLNNRSYNRYKNRYNESYTYDKMGNITSLQRNGMRGVIDSLTYSYDGNRLQNITESLSNGLQDLGFKDSVPGIKYLYDTSGKLIEDRNKDIRIRYNTLDLTGVIQHASTGKKLEYSYLADGRRIRKQFGTTTDRHYISGFEYEGDELKFISMPEGRIRKSGDKWIYDYFLTDHLDNVRVVLTTGQSGTQVYTASMEESNAIEETKYFNNVDNTRADRPYNYPDKNPLNTKLAKVPGKSRGPSVMLQVMAGDTISLSAQAFYNMDSSLPGSGLNIAPVVGSAIAALSGNTALAAGEFSTLAADLGATASTSAVLAPLPEKNEEDDSPEPNSGLNFVLYNRNFEIVESNTGVLPVSDKINRIQMLSGDQMIIQESGYLEVFTYNDAQTPVFFDNIELRHTSGPILEENHYYPFGMLMDMSYMPVAVNERNFYKYGRKELQTEHNLNWGDHGARMSDYTIGRWWVPDPLAEQYYGISTYTYTLNNPLKNIDPDGMENITIIGAQYDGLRGNKLMFANQGIRSLRRWSLLQSDESRSMVLFTGDYTEKQISKIESSVEKYGGNLIKVDSADEMINYVNSKSSENGQLSDARKNDLITDMEIFSHGEVGSIGFGYRTEQASAYELNDRNVTKFNSGAFDGTNSTITSYACRTALGNNSYHSYTNPMPMWTSSIAQSISDATGATVYAYGRRTNYSYTLGNPFERRVNPPNIHMIDGAAFTPNGAVRGVVSGYSPVVFPGKIKFIPIR
jgi:RHS repeat-associated protein